MRCTIYAHVVLSDMGSFASTATQAGPCPTCCRTMVQALTSILHDPARVRACARRTECDARCTGVSYVKGRCQDQPNCNCPRVVGPDVCGTDGRFYRSECEAACAGAETQEDRKACKRKGKASVPDAVPLPYTASDRPGCHVHATSNARQCRLKRRQASSAGRVRHSGRA